MGKSGDDGGGGPSDGIGGGGTDRGGGGGGGTGKDGGGGDRGGGGDLGGSGGGGPDPGGPGGVGAGPDPGGPGGAGTGPDPGTGDTQTTDSQAGAPEQTRSLDTLGTGPGAGAGASAALSGGGYGDPLSASDPSAALSVSGGDPLEPTGEPGGGGDPMQVEGAPATGTIGPTDRASQGSMLDTANQQQADRVGAEDAAAQELYGPGYTSEGEPYAPGSQLPSEDFGTTPGPAMRPGTEQADTLAGQQTAELGQSDVPLDATGTFEDRFAPAEGLSPAIDPGPYGITGTKPPGADASQGDMLSYQRQVDRAEQDQRDTALADLGLNTPDRPGSQLPTFDQRYSGTPAPDSGGPSEPDWWSTYGEGPDAPTTLPPLGPYRDIALKDQEQLPGPIPGGVGSTESAVPPITSSDIYPMNLGGYAGAAGQTVVDPGAATRYDAANPPSGGFSGNAPGALFLGADAGLTGMGAPIGTGAAPVDPQVTADENAALRLRLGDAPDALGPDLNQPFFQSLPGAASYMLPGTLPNDPNALTGTAPPRLPPDTGIRTDNAMLAPGSIDLTETFPQEYTPTEQEIAQQYGATGLGGYNTLTQGGGAPPTAAEQVANRFPEGPGPDLNRPFFQSSPDAPSFTLPGALPYTDARTPLTPSEQVERRFPAPESDVGPKSVTPEIVRPPSGGGSTTSGPGGPGPAGPGTGPGTPGIGPGAPETPGVPPDIGAPSAPPSAPLDGGGTALAGLTDRTTQRGGFERGPPPNLPPPPQLVNAMLSNASPALQQAAASLNPQQQMQISQYTFGLINQYRQMLENQGGFADPNSAEWQQQILPQIRQQVAQFTRQITGR